MKQRLVLAAWSAAVLTVTATAALAQSAAPLHLDRTVAIDAPPAKVWSMIGHFAGMTWHPAIKASSATQGDTPGSVRTLDLGGPRLVEQLAAYDAAKMTYTYTITDLPANTQVLPVTAYTSTISVRPGPNATSVVDWQGTFRRLDPSATPQSGQDDAAALKAIDGVYSGGLAQLKKAAEAD